MSRFAIRLLLTLLLGLLWPKLPASSAPEDDLRQAVDAYARADLRQARTILESLQQDPGEVGGRAEYLLGILDLQQKKFSMAVTDFAQAAEKLPVLADHAVYYRAVGAFDAGDYVQAAQEFQEILDRFPTSTLRGLALFWQAESQWELHSPDAPAAFQRYLAEYGQGAHAAQAWFHLGESLRQLNLWADAAQAYRRVRWGFEGSPYWAPAQARLNELAAHHPLPPDATPPEVFYLRALADAGGGYFGPARAALLHVLSMKDGWRIADDALYQLGVLAYKSGRLNEASGYFWRDVRLYAAHGDDSLYYLVRIALGRGRDRDAMTIARQLIHDYPGSSLAPRSLYAIAQARQDRGALGPAMALFREAGERFPATHWGQQALWAVGWGHYRTHQWGVARTTWLRAAQQPDGDAAPAALYWAARAAEALHMSDLAGDDYRRLAALYPDSYYGQRAAERLNLPIRVTVAALPDLPPGAVPAFDRYRELDALAQIDDATAELVAAAQDAPSGYREAMGAILSQRYTQQGEVDRGIALAEEIRGQARGAVDGLPLLLWEALYPQVFWEPITAAASRRGIDPYLVAGVIREESRFDPHAVSAADAYGLMQLLPGTAKSAARVAGLSAPDLRALTDPHTNIALGSFVLQQLLRQFNRIDLALAAYNAGPGAVGRWQAQSANSEPDAFVEEIPYAETRGYVKTVMQSTAMYHWLYRDGHPSGLP
jgi:peptidoglycan lytic transglycosylase